jgi:hypothetical protein
MPRGAVLTGSVVDQEGSKVPERQRHTAELRVE